jgi:hypothetical protein
MRLCAECLLAGGWWRRWRDAEFVNRVCPHGGKGLNHG